MVMGLWNFLLLGSTVTMGLKVARLPRIFFTVSSGTGWACQRTGEHWSVTCVSFMWIFVLHVHLCVLFISPRERESWIKHLTCSPTLIFFVNAPSGKEAWTNGTLRLHRVPPSGPIWLVSCLMRDTTAKYCGKSLVMMRQILFLSSSSGLSSSTEKESTQINQSQS